MFGFGNTKKKRMTAKRAKVQQLIKQKGIRRNVYLGYTDEGTLDDIIAMGYFADMYYDQFGINEEDIPQNSAPVEDEPVISDASVKETAVAAATFAAENHDYISHSNSRYSAPESDYTPEPEPTRTSYSSGFSDSGGSDYSSSDSGGGSDD